MERLKQLKLVKIINAFLGFIQNFISESFIYKVLTKNITFKKESFIEKILYKIFSFLRIIFNKLKLNILFEGSIFAKTEIFVAITIMLVPIVPTMLSLLLVIRYFCFFLFKSDVK